MWKNDISFGTLFGGNFEYEEITELLFYILLGSYFL